MMKNIIDRLKEHKLKHELPNDNDGEYNYGFVKAVNIAINLVQSNVVLPAVIKCEHNNKKWIPQIAETYCSSCREIL
jgi:CTP-dependent riboflavin kinase